jgi:soluble lytic murein transglycosylase
MKRFGISLIIFLLASSSVWAVTGDETFLHAQSAYQSRNDTQLAADANQLHAQNHVLAAYADYWLMLLKLSTSDKATVQAFLAQNADYPFTDKVRAEWLKVLAKRQDWPDFFEEFPRYKRDDVAVTCFAIEGRAKGGDVIALAEGRTLWMTSTEQPSNCNNVFDLMQQSKLLTQDDIWARFRLAMQDGKLALAKAVIQRDESVNKSQLKLIDSVYQNPQTALDKKAISYKTHLGRALNLYAIDRLAHAQLDEAMTTWRKVSNYFEDDEKAYMWGRFAMHAARRHDDSALDLYSKVRNIDLDKEQIAWKVRAALLARSWAIVQTTIADMPQAQQEEDVWRYWRGRAYKELRDVPKANAILVSLAREHTYYGLLAEEELGTVLNERATNYVPSETEVSAIRSQPAMQRALELDRLGFRWESRAEWAWGIKDYDDKQMLAASELALRQNWYDVAINTAEKTKYMHNFALRYPVPYRETVQNFCKENGLDEAWVYGLTRQESRFVTYAKSGVGASGLMQVMPSTASWVAKKMGITDYKHHMIDQTDTNIRLGTFYLRYTLDLMSGQAAMATAAYNAGPGRAKKWAPKQPLEGAIYAETIPVLETRQYVQKVLANSCFYANLLGTKTQTIKQRLGVIAGSNSGVVLAAEEAVED